MNPLSNWTAFADAWWSCVLHSTCQSSLVVLAAFAVVWLRRKRSATFLYAVLVVALLKFLVPPIISLPVLEHPSAAPVATHSSEFTPGPAPAVASALVVSEDTPASQPPLAAAPSLEAERTTSSPPAPAPQPVTEIALAAPSAEPPVTPVVPATPSSSEAPVVAPTPPARAINLRDHWKLLLALLHGTGILVLGLLMANAYLHLRRLLRAAQPAGPELSNLANEVAERLGLRRRVSVLLTAAPCAPMAAGLFKRRILLPEALAGLKPEELRAILAHELAHHRRLDLAFIWVEHLATLLWWFNPLVWMLIRALHRTREDCCDDMVLSLGLAGDSEYCDTLLRAAKRLHRPLAPRLIFGCASKLHPMAQRLTRIMDTAIRRRAALTAWGTAGVIVMGLVLLPTFLPVAADANDARTSTDETRTSTDAAQTAQASAATSTATVSAKAESGKEWYDTGIVMTAGMTFALTAEGSVSWDRNLPRVTPAGAGRTPNASCGRPEEFPMPDAPCGGLLGRMGEGLAFFIGERTTVTGDGSNLFLTVNDRLNNFGDNDGSFIVTVAPAGSKSSEASPQPAGPRGKVLRFDGQNDYVLVPPAKPLDLSETLTISAWVRIEPGCSDEAPVLRRGDARPGYDPYMFGVYRGQMHLGAFRDTSINHNTAELVSAAYDTDWHYWTGVRDAQAGRLYLYRDGRLVDQAPVSGPLQYSTESMGNEMGAIDQGAWSRGSNWGFFKGEIDQVSVWNIARKPEDIQREMKEGIKPEEPGLVALWTFDEEGQSVKDSSPSGIAATLGSSSEPDENDPARVDPHAAPAQTVAAISSDPVSKIDEEITAHYANADAEIQDYIRWTAKNFTRGNLWFAHDAFAQLSPDEREKRIVQTVEALNAEYGRHLCPALAEAGALKDARLLPGLIKAASYHRDDSDYDCRPKWMAVSALGRQDDISAVPTLIPLVDHGNTNTRMWARASLVRLTGQNFKDDKQAWGTWWNNSGHEPKIDLAQLKPWVMPGQAQAATPPPAAPPSRPLQPAVVPPESQAVVDALPGELVFKGAYFHRSRGSDLSAPSVVWIKKTGEGEFIAASYLPSINETTVAYVSKQSLLRRYEGHYHGRDGQTSFRRFLELADGTVGVTNEGGEKDGQFETLTVPSKALFMPNSRPDSYSAHMGYFQLSVPSVTDPDDVPCYDWDNSGKGMASYTIRMENKGKEEITVPAGTFTANHVVETQLTSGDTWYKKRAGHTTDYWVLDNGVIVRILRHREPYELQLLNVEAPAELPGFLGEAEMKPAGTLTILSAVYGAADSWVDLTEILNQRIQNDTLEVQITNELGGDPVYGSPKQLNVHYRVGDKTYVITVDELEMLRLPEPPKQQSSSNQVGTQSRQGAAATATAQASAGTPAGLQSQPASNSDDMVVLNREKMVQEMASLNYADVVTTLNPWMVKDNEGKYIGIASDNFAGVPLCGVIGLQNGDVVNTINGVKVDSDQKLAEIFEKFANAVNFRLGVIRNG
ncbi:MAG: M48 family metalloprotease, partial [Candidatus Hydrogenedentes bacterium]|nr:M48 family metalloprotease [Candidatus Hydrogenedentota bacterium]